MECWICGQAAADTREHRAKRTDLLSVFGKPSPSNPLFIHNAEGGNRMVRSLKADILKYEHRICQRCNSARTQKHDMAWKQFSEVIRRRYLYSPRTQRVKCSSIFPYDTARLMRDVHLYFVKAFGCQIVEGKIPIDIKSFACSIMEDKPHPNLHLSFGMAPKLPVVSVGGEDVWVESVGEEMMIAGWIYHVGALCVTVKYVQPIQDCLGLKTSWHPRQGTKYFTIESVNGDADDL